MIFRHGGKGRSWWHTPVPKSVGPDAESDHFMAALAEANPAPHLRLSGPAWAMPIYRPTEADPLVTIDPTGTGPTTTFRLPADATPMSGNDAAAVVLDHTTGQVISLFELARDTAGGWSATGLGRYAMSSEGLDERVGGTPGNTGHRGLPGSQHALRREHLAADRIEDRLKIAIPGTAEWHVFPMAGHESGRGGVIGEGVVMRLKPWVVVRELGLGLTGQKIARMLKRFGVVIGDNGGTATLKIERGLELEPDLLEVLTWDHFEIVERGWR